jgi:hypothetical protein
MPGVAAECRTKPFRPDPSSDHSRGTVPTATSPATPEPGTQRHRRTGQRPNKASLPQHVVGTRQSEGGGRRRRSGSGHAPQALIGAARIAQSDLLGGLRPPWPDIQLGPGRAGPLRKDPAPVLSKTLREGPSIARRPDAAATRHPSQLLSLILAALGATAYDRLHGRRLERASDVPVKGQRPGRPGPCQPAGRLRASADGSASTTATTAPQPRGPGPRYQHRRVRVHRRPGRPAKRITLGLFASPLAGYP